MESRHLLMKPMDKLTDAEMSQLVLMFEIAPRLADAYHHRFHEIFIFLEVPWTNGFIEGCNNKTKILKRTCYGTRNFNNFRKRILFCNT